MKLNSGNGIFLPRLGENLCLVERKSTVTTHHYTKPRFSTKSDTTGFGFAAVFLNPCKPGLLFAKIKCVIEAQN